MLKVRSDRLDEYKGHHEAVWPEMLEALSRNGWHNYSLFMAGDGLMFGYFEADESLEASLAWRTRTPTGAGRSCWRRSSRSGRERCPTSG